MFACAALSWALVLQMGAAVAGASGYVEAADFMIDTGRVVFALALVLMLGSLLSSRRLDPELARPR